jgi:hypothetical protein
VKRPITERIAHVHIDRLVLRNVDLGAHDGRTLTGLIATKLGRGEGARDGSALISPNAVAVAVAIADRVRAELRRASETR